MKEQLKIEVLVDIDYVEGQRENAINEALRCVLSARVYGSKYRIDAIDSKVIFSTPRFESEKNVDDCKYFDLAQGRRRCALHGFKIKSCHGVCDDFKQK